MFGILNIFFVGADGLFFGMFKGTYHKILHIIVHACAGVNHKDDIK